MPRNPERRAPRKPMPIPVVTTARGMAAALGGVAAGSAVPGANLPEASASAQDPCRVVADDLRTRDIDVKDSNSLKDIVHTMAAMYKYRLFSNIILFKDGSSSDRGGVQRRKKRFTDIYHSRFKSEFEDIVKLLEEKNVLNKTALLILVDRIAPVLNGADTEATNNTLAGIREAKDIISKITQDNTGRTGIANTALAYVTQAVKHYRPYNLSQLFKSDAINGMFERFAAAQHASFEQSRSEDIDEVFSMNIPIELLRLSKMLTREELQKIVNDDTSLLNAKPIADAIDYLASKHGDLQRQNKGGNTETRRHTLNTTSNRGILLSSPKDAMKIAHDLNGALTRSTTSSEFRAERSKIAVAWAKHAAEEEQPARSPTP